jgi:hypothetical protein
VFWSQKYWLWSLCKVFKATIANIFATKTNIFATKTNIFATKTNIFATIKRCIAVLARLSEPLKVLIKVLIKVYIKWLRQKNKKSFNQIALVSCQIIPVSGQKCENLHICKLCAGGQIIPAGCR